MEAVTAVWGRKARRFMLEVDKAQMVDGGESGRRRNTVDNGGTILVKARTKGDYVTKL